jgi:predicted unusual protein kinase regulating ubiquinone biosynthesis (AarF/ABC1/UbiB family)
MDQVTMDDARAPAGAARRVRWRITVRSAQMLRAGVAAARVFAREGVRLRRQAPGEAVTRAAGRALVALCTGLGATFIKVG